MAYVELEDVKNTLDLAGETYADADLESALAAASKAVDQFCGRSFNVVDETTVATTRIYEPQRERQLFIDDLVELEGIAYGVIDAEEPLTSIAASGFSLKPFNAEADLKPYEEIRLRDMGSVAWCTDHQDTTVHVTGKFGWPLLPVVVPQATTLLTTRLLKRAREAPFGVAGIGGDGIAVRITADDPDVARLLGSVSRAVRLS